MLQLYTPRLYTTFGQLLQKRQKAQRAHSNFFKVIGQQDSTLSFFFEYDLGRKRKVSTCIRNLLTYGPWWDSQNRSER